MSFEIQRYSSLSQLGMLSVEERKILAASTISPDNKKIVHLDVYGVADLVEYILLRASIRLGEKKKEDDEYSILFQVVNEDIQTKFPQQTEGEIKEALEAGLDGQFTMKGSALYFSPSNFVQWVREWLDKKKGPAIQKAFLLTAKEEPDYMPELSLRDSLNSKFIILHDAFRSALDGGRFYDGGNAIYRLLSSINHEGLLPMESERDMRHESARILKGIIANGPDDCIGFLNHVRERIHQLLADSKNG
jgi:hypothetical protein